MQVMRLTTEATLPTRAHADDAGLDLYALDDVQLNPGEGTTIRTGISVALPPHSVGIIADRSSLAKKGLKTAGGVIDAGYRGEIKIVMWNISQAPVRLLRGERIAQMLIFPILTPAVEEVTELSETSRGEGGFGSTGR